MLGKLYYGRFIKTIYFATLLLFFVIIPRVICAEGNSQINKENILKYDELIFKARTYGAVRIIVGLKMESFQPESDLPNPQAVQSQRDAIAKLQDRLLDRMTLYNVTSVKRFKYIPYIAMEVDEVGLLDLISNPDISSIEEDIAVPPSKVHIE